MWDSQKRLIWQARILISKNSMKKNNESNNQLDKNLDSQSKEKIKNQGPVVQKPDTENNSNSDK